MFNLEWVILVILQIILYVCVYIAEGGHKSSVNDVYNVQTLGPSVGHRKKKKEFKFLIHNGRS